MQPLNEQPIYQETKLNMQLKQILKLFFSKTKAEFCTNATEGMPNKLYKMRQLQPTKKQISMC